MFKEVFGCAERKIEFYKLGSSFFSSRMGRLRINIEFLFVLSFFISAEELYGIFIELCFFFQREMTKCVILIISHFSTVMLD